MTTAGPAKDHPDILLRHLSDSFMICFSAMAPKVEKFDKNGMRGYSYMR